MRVEVFLSSRAPYTTGQALPEEGREGHPFHGLAQVYGRPYAPMTWAVVGHEVGHLLLGPRCYTKIAAPDGLRWASWREAVAYHLGEAAAWRLAPLGLAVFAVLALAGRVRIYRVDRE